MEHDQRQIDPDSADRHLSHALDDQGRRVTPLVEQGFERTGDDAVPASRPCGQLFRRPRPAQHSVALRAGRPPTGLPEAQRSAESARGLVDFVAPFFDGVGLTADVNWRGGIYRACRNLLRGSKTRLSQGQ
jgi:hypothetical protein